MYLSIYLSIYDETRYLSIYVCMYVSMYLYIYVCFYVCIYLAIYLSMYLYIFLSYLYIYLCIYLSYLSIRGLGKLETRIDLCKGATSAGPANCYRRASSVFKGDDDSKILLCVGTLSEDSAVSIYLSIYLITHLSI
jgi:hypothetical protein